MVNNEYVVPKDYKKVEEIREIENAIPTYEEFMKNYESDGKVNYDDLSDGEVIEVEGYGPCSSCGNRSLTFKLKIVLENCMGGQAGMKVHNIDDARSEARKIVAETGHWEDRFLGYFSRTDRRKLADRINDKIKYHKEGNNVDTSVCNKDPIDHKAAIEQWERTEFLLEEMHSYPGGDRSSGRDDHFMF